MFTKADVGTRNRNGQTIELSETEKERIAQSWNVNASAPTPDPTLSDETKALADELGVDQGKLIARLKQMRAAQ